MQPSNVHGPRVGPPGPAPSSRASCYGTESYVCTQDARAPRATIPRRPHHDVVDEPPAAGEVTQAGVFTYGGLEVHGPHSRRALSASVLRATSAAGRGGSCGRPQGSLHPAVTGKPRVCGPSAASARSGETASSSSDTSRQALRVWRRWSLGNPRERSVRPAISASRQALRPLMRVSPARPKHRRGVEEVTHAPNTSPPTSSTTPPSTSATAAPLLAFLAVSQLAAPDADPAPCPPSSI